MSSAYHHGSLREVLLDEARWLLVERGLEAVTLRELARRAGVSHAAPNRHFADRDALLRELAARGFDELSRALRAAARDGDPRSRLSSYAHAHVRFALDNGPLLSLMFGTKPAADGAVAESAARFFALGGELLGEDPAGEIGPLPYLLAATLEGISALVVAGRLPSDRIEEVLDAAFETLLPRIEAQVRARSHAEVRAGATAASRDRSSPRPECR